MTTTATNNCQSDDEKSGDQNN